MAIYSYRLSRGQTRWMFTIDLPPAADGRRRQMNRKGFLRQEDAQVAETKARQSYARSELAADGSLAAELQAWLGERELDVAETTLGNYRDIVQCYIVPHLGSRQVYTLTKRAIHDLYKTLLTRGSKRGGPLSRTTVRTVHRVLMKALGDLHIVIEGVRKPRKEDRDTPGRKGVWTPEQAARFLTHHADHRLCAAWVLAIVIGLRRGSCSACAGTRLTWTGGRWRCTGSAPPPPATVPSRRRPRAGASAPSRSAVSR